MEILLIPKVSIFPFLFASVLIEATSFVAMEMGNMGRHHSLERPPERVGENSQAAALLEVMGGTQGLQMSLKLVHLSAGCKKPGCPGQFNKTTQVGFSCNNFDPCSNHV